MLKIKIYKQLILTVKNKAFVYKFITFKTRTKFNQIYIST